MSMFNKWLFMQKKNFMVYFFTLIQQNGLSMPEDINKYLAIEIKLAKGECWYIPDGRSARRFRRYSSKPEVTAQEKQLLKKGRYLLSKAFNTPAFNLHVFNQSVRMEKK